MIKKMLLLSAILLVPSYLFADVFCPQTIDCTHASSLAQCQKHEGWMYSINSGTSFHKGIYSPNR